MKKGVIFDLDGTLWDAASQITASWNECLIQKLGRPELVITDEDMRNACGLTMTAIGQRLFPSLSENPEEMENILESVMNYENEYLRTKGGRVYPGLEACLSRLKEKGYHLYIVSNCQKGYIESFLEWSGLERWFEDRECFGNTGLSKDGSIRMLYDRNNLDAAVYVGDTQGDYDSTMKAGLHFILAGYGFGQVNETVPVIDSLDQLPDMVERLL